MRKSNQDMKIKFNKENEVLKKNKIETMVKMKNANGQIKSTVESHIEKMNYEDDRLSRQGGGVGSFGEGQ